MAKVERVILDSPTSPRHQYPQAHATPRPPMSANPGSLKRKHSGKTIKELFTTQSKPNTALAAPLSPSKKRTRRESSPVATAEAATPPAPSSNMSTADMYHFPSKRAGMPSSAEVVDITSSPENSPAKANAPRNGMRKVAPNMHASGGPKRLLVKNFKPTRKVDPKVFLEQTWQKIDKALSTIFAQGTVDFSLEELYRGVENVCRQGMARDVKEKLIAKCKEYVGGPLKTKVKESLSRGNAETLRAALRAWAVWNEQMVGRVITRDDVHILIAAEIPRLDLLLPRPRIPAATPRVPSRDLHRPLPLHHICTRQAQSANR